MAGLTVLQFLSKKNVVTVEVKANFGGFYRLFDFLLEGGGEVFVGIEEKNPVPFGFFEGEVTLRGEVVEGAGEDFGFVFAGDFEGVVMGVVVNDDDFVNEFQ